MYMYIYVCFPFKMVDVPMLDTPTAPPTNMLYDDIDLYGQSIEQEKKDDIKEKIEEEHVHVHFVPLTSEFVCGCF